MIRKILFHLVLTLTLFSLWAGFALLVVNKLFYKDLPGYRIGRLCIWEFIALLIAAFIAGFMIRRWGTIELKEIHGQKRLSLHPNYGIYFIIYFLIAIITAIWQFWLFSQQF